MRLLFGSFFTFLLAAVIGLGATWFTLTRGVAFGSLTIGAWTAWPKTGSQDIDPYAHASIARDGELPIGIGDGVAFFARADDKGHELDGRCTFALSGMTPPARYWTVTLYNIARRPCCQCHRSARLHQPGNHPRCRWPLHHHGCAAGTAGQLAADGRDRALCPGVAPL